MLTRLLFCAALTWASLTSANAAAIRFAVLDSETGKSIPARIHLKDSANKPVRPNGLPFWYDHFVCAGVAELDLAPGAYRYEIERGPEYAQVTGSVTISESSTPPITNHLDPRDLLSCSELRSAVATLRGQRFRCAAKSCGL